ncbi:MAG: hypothetical protein U0Q11_01555 [Vicinamibacterales bacterium]
MQPGTQAARSGGTASSGLTRHVSAWLTSGVVWSLIVSAAAVAMVFGPLGGWEYYGSPLETRAYADGHRLLRPSGAIGQTLGMIGAALVLVPFLYMARKRMAGAKGIGGLRGWLELHLFCGIVGPVLVTMHTTFKFNGIVSAAYWSMVVVMLSGFVGRYLYVRIPRSIRGTELTRSDLDARSESLKVEIAESAQSMDVLRLVQAFEHDSVPDASRVSMLGVFVGDLGFGRRRRRLVHELETAGLEPELAHRVVDLTAERATLLRRIAYLQKTKTLFGLWHVLHLPLVYLLLLIVAVHVGITLYLGYVPFRW